MVYLLLLLLTSFVLMSALTSAALKPVTEQKIAILGGGIHGASIAYYLSQMGCKPVIIEKTSIAAAASGKAGGFLARNWGRGKALNAMHTKSFDLHAELANELSLESYRPVKVLSVNGNRKGNTDASWLDGRATSSVMESNPMLPLRADAAQVTPLELTTKLVDAAITRGTEVIIDSVDGVMIEDNEVKGIHLRSKTDGPLLVDKVVVAMGPWSSPFVEDNFEVPLPMEGIKSTSIVYSDLKEVKQDPWACFCDEDENSCHLELYPRPNGDLYICGCGGSDYVRGDRLREGGDCDSADKIRADPKRVAAASTSFKTMTSLGNNPPSIEQACMRPCANDGLPVMGEIPGYSNAYVSTAHNCWGILWAPVSGLLMAELLVNGKTSTVDISSFSIARFSKQGYKVEKRGKKVKGNPIGEQW